MFPTIIAISGPSASGKTLFAKTIYDQVNDERPDLGLAIVQEDSYYRDQSHLPFETRVQVNYDHPSTLEHELMLKHLQELRQNKAVEIPVYDYTEHTRSSKTRWQEPAQVIIVEGILLLSDAKLRAQFDIKLYVDTPLDFCLLRRIARDMQERGRSLKAITEQYENSVRPMYYQFIQPSARFADLVITGGGKNQVALDIVKNKILTLLDQGAKTDGANADGQAVSSDQPGAKGSDQ